MGADLEPDKQRSELSTSRQNQRKSYIFKYIFLILNPGIS